MAKYVAVGKVTIGDGSVINKNKDSRFFGGPTFVSGDTVELTEALAKKYGHLFDKAKATEKNKKGETAKNK